MGIVAFVTSQLEKGNAELRRPNHSGNRHRLKNRALAFTVKDCSDGVIPVSRDIPHAYPFIPALAIPVVRKEHYECPVDHLNRLDAFLPKVTKLLVIGWRANESHFLERLQKNLTGNDIRVMIVSDSEKGAKQAIIS